MSERAHLIVGLGVTGTAVARALHRRGIPVVAIEDRLTDAHRTLAAELGFTLHEAPEASAMLAIVDSVGFLVPSPGVPDWHPVFAAAAAAGVVQVSEFDLAARWDDRPIAAITGTDGKTTVTTMVTEMLNQAGRRAIDAGNTAVPLVEAIDDPDLDVFVVEASSFRLGHSRAFAPRVATWLNWGPDHLDVHADLASYRAAKASIWNNLGPDSTAIANADDPVVADHAPDTALLFSTTRRPDEAAYVAHDGKLHAFGDPYFAIVDLARSLPHDIANALAATATAQAAGADLDAIAAVLRTFGGLAHRVQHVGECGGVRYINDSKATVPHAVVAAVNSFESVVLIAGGRNKGIDLAPLAEPRERIRSVVAIGDAAAEVESAFAGIRDVVTAESMAEAVQAATAAAEPGDVVLLSPGCASFDWYGNYGERGDDFIRVVKEELGPC